MGWHGCAEHCDKRKQSGTVEDRDAWWVVELRFFTFNLVVYLTLPTCLGGGHRAVTIESLSVSGHSVVGHYSSCSFLLYLLWYLYVCCFAFCCALVTCICWAFYTRTHRTHTHNFTTTHLLLTPVLTCVLPALPSLLLLPQTPTIPHGGMGPLFNGERMELDSIWQGQVHCSSPFVSFFFRHFHSFHLFCMAAWTGSATFSRKRQTRKTNVSFLLLHKNNLYSMETGGWAGGGGSGSITVMCGVPLPTFFLAFCSYHHPSPLLCSHLFACSTELLCVAFPALLPGRRAFERCVRAKLYFKPPVEHLLYPVHTPPPPRLYPHTPTAHLPSHLYPAHCSNILLCLFLYTHLLTILRIPFCAPSSCCTL